MRVTVGCSKGVQLEVFGDPQRGAFGGLNGVQLDVLREPQRGCSWRLLVGLKMSWTSKLKFSGILRIIAIVY